eukprot:CAMPEP_0198125028 /NCGR_PEP_ID=MMETSP1442-20131203/41592_1 /TAXON_ID= /ORGANISM="Craspedostauros australis, Strain CCMP3328" /LENGTH=157 /DNA_ID=CAMNT_0043784555 /DNA_START=289 /DNA_END=758 /DNA_ORIENTATION=-
MLTWAFWVAPLILSVEQSDPLVSQCSVRCGVDLTCANGYSAHCGMRSLDVSSVGGLSEGGSEWLEEDWCLIDDTDLSDEFLEGEGGDGDHRETSVLDLGELEPLLALLGLWEDTEWVETQVTWGVVWVGAAGFLESDDLDSGSEGEDGDPVDWGDLS